ncbi:hypothetical protein MBLNU13_g00640t2 [Cladosporium sp. NU13]
MSLRPHEYEVHAIRSIIQEVHALWEIIISSSPDLPESWRDEFSRFQLWEHSMSQQLITNWLLNELLEYLDDIYNILSGMRQDRSEGINDEEMRTRGSEETEPVSELVELWLMVKDVLTSLLKAAALARRNGRSHHAQHAVREATRTNKSLVYDAIFQSWSTKNGFYFESAR